MNKTIITMPDDSNKFILKEFLLRLNKNKSEKYDCEFLYAKGILYPTKKRLFKRKDLENYDKFNYSTNNRNY